MTRKISNTEVISNELLIEKYEPIMVITLSHSTTMRLVGKLKEFALDISERTNYEVLMFPDEEQTTVKIVSVCKADKIDLKDIKDYIYKKYEQTNLEDTPFSRIKDIIEKRNEEK
tara:strand:+ start:326 stop:670 length:345 start_codon:yes stop_codon:yes gene_type:complete